MIMRIWRGKTPLDKADAYTSFTEKTAAPDYRSVPGLQRYFFTRRDHVDHAEFVLITIWDSVDAIKQFAGDEYSKAKYYPEDKGFLLDFPEEVEHYTVFAADQIQE